MQSLEICRDVRVGIFRKRSLWENHPLVVPSGAGVVMLQRARIFGAANTRTEVYRYDTSTEDATNELIILNSEMITTKRAKTHERSTT